MPVCRYMFKDEFDAIYNGMGENLRELCDEIKKLTGQRYAVEDNSYPVVTGWGPFKKRKIVESFVILTPTFEGEVQCINLWSGLGGGYTRNEAGAYLVGVRAEAWRNRKPAADASNGYDFAYVLKTIQEMPKEEFERLCMECMSKRPADAERSGEDG